MSHGLSAMTTIHEIEATDADKKVLQEHDVEHNAHGILTDSDESILGKDDILSREHIDPVLNAKMHLVNNVSISCLNKRKSAKTAERGLEG